MTRPLRFLLPAAAIATFLVAVLIRLPGLEEKPFHTDEANNAFILEETLQSGGFKYRIEDHHGPTLFWLAAIPFKVGGIHSVAEMEPWMLRGVAVLCSAAAAAAIFLLVPYISPAAAGITAVFLILAAPFHYYGRTFIHESLLLFLTLLLLAALFRWRSSGKFLWAGLTGLAAGAMILTKENAAVTALLLTAPFLLPDKGFRSGLKLKLPVMFLVACVVVIPVMGWENIIQASMSHVDRGLRSGHHWPWWQYLSWFVFPQGPGLPWSGWIVFLMAALAVWRRKEDPVVVPLLVGFILLFLFHSLLPYKTPWLILGPALPLVLLAGIGGVELGKRIRPKVWIPLAILGMVLLSSETWARSFHNEVAVGNPMAYSPTDPQTKELIQKVDAFASVNSKGKDLVIQVVGPDYWPLPWLLRHYPNVGFWNDAPEQWPGDLLICTPEGFGWVPKPDQWTFRPYSIRPGVIVFVGVPSNGK